MGSAFEMACLLSDIRRAIGHAVAAKMDEHFVSDLKHLEATARHNEDADKEESK